MDWSRDRKRAGYIEAMREICLNDFKSFCIFVFRYVYKKEFLWSWHHDVMKEALMRVFLGLDKNLIINLPPRYGKTEIMCLFAAWTYAHNHSCEYLHLSYSEDLSVRNSEKIRQIIKSKFFSDLYGIEFDRLNDGKAEWHTLDGGIFKAAATGGQVTGFGAGSTGELGPDGVFRYSGCIFIDDPLKPSDAHTMRREQINHHWDETIKSRRNNPTTTPVMCIMQRIHEGDFTSHLIADEYENFKVLKMQALDYTRENVALWPAKHDAKALEALRDTNAYSFSSQYQQNPTPIGGSVFKSKWWRYYIELPESFDEVIITADTAQKTKTHNDWSVFQLWGLYKNNIYLIDQVRGKWEAPDLIRVAGAFINKCKKQYVKLKIIYIEDKASGTGLIQALATETSCVIKPVNRALDKVTRAFDVCTYVEGGKVHLPEGASFVEGFVDECSSFSPTMSHLHDDQVDPMIDAIDILLDKRMVAEGVSMMGLF